VAGAIPMRPLSALGTDRSARAEDQSGETSSVRSGSLADIGPARQGCPLYAR